VFLSQVHNLNVVGRDIRQPKSTNLLQTQGAVLTNNVKVVHRVENNKV
jgi:hypothetical protein